MAIKYKFIEEGMVLWDCHRYKMGNTSMSCWGNWPVRIISLTDNGAMASWNGNRATLWSISKLEKLYRQIPASKRGGKL